MTDAGRTVVLKAPPRASLAAVAEALAQARGVPVLDTSREARSSWGLIGDNLSNDEAERLVAALASRGVPAAVRAAAELPALPAVLESDKIDIGDTGFRGRLKAGETPLIPWSNVRFVAAVVLKDTTFKTVTKKEGPSAASKLIRTGVFMTTGIPLPGGKTKEVQVRQEKTELRAFLDIALIAPAGRLRFEAGELDVNYLGARRVYDSLGNFRLMVADAAARVAPESVNHGAQALIASAALTSMGYESMAEFEREERWMLARAAL